MLSLLDQGTRRKLTDKEIRSVCQQLHAQDSPSEYILGLKLGLQLGNIDPNVALVELISNGDRENDLYSIALCLRYGGNSNVYVSSTTLSQHIHILGLAYNSAQKASDEAYLHTLIGLLILDGAQLTKKIFDPSFGSIKKTVVLDDSPTVLNYLSQNGYDVIETIHKEGLVKHLSPKTMNYLNVLLDRPGDVKFDFNVKQPSQMNIRNMMIIKSLNNMNIDVQVNQNNMWNNIDLNNTLMYLNGNAFEKVLKAGVKVSYPMINDILLRGLKYRELKLEFCEKTILKMVDLMVQNGTELDSYQSSVLSTLDSTLVDSITKLKQKPYWRKTCQIKKGDMSLKLKQLATLFDIPLHDKEFVCDRLSELAKRDPIELSQAIKSQRLRSLSLKLGWTEEFIAGNPPTLVCTNKLSQPYDEYNDLSVSSFRESDDSVWCFTSDQYESLLSTKRNPFGGDLPEDFLNEIKFKLNTLRSLGMDPSKTSKLSDRIAMLSQPDTEDTTSKTLDQLLDMLAEEGVAKSKYYSLKKEDIKRNLQSLGIYIGIQGLSDEHIRVTYAWIIGWLKDNEPSLYRQTIVELKSIRK